MIPFAVIAALGALAIGGGAIVYWLAEPPEYRGRHGRPLADGPLSPEDARTLAWLEGLHRKPVLRGPVRPACTWQAAALKASIAYLAGLRDAGQAPLLYAQREPFTDWLSDSFVGTIPAVRP